MADIEMTNKQRIDKNNDDLELIEQQIKNLPEAAIPIYAVSDLQYNVTPATSSESISSYCKGYYTRLIQISNTFKKCEFYKLNNDNSSTKVFEFTQSTTIWKLIIIDVIDDDLYYLLANNTSGQTNKFYVKKLNLTALTNEDYFTATTSSSYYSSGFTPILYDNYYFFFYNGIYKVDLKNKTLINVKNPPAYTGLSNLHPDFYYTANGDDTSGRVWLHKISTNKTFSQNNGANFKFINETGTKCIKGLDLYVLNPDLTLGPLIKSDIIASGYSFYFVGNGIYLSKDGLYEFDETTNTFTKTDSINNLSCDGNVPTFLSGGYYNFITKEIDTETIIGYNLGNKNYYAEAAASVYSSDILEGKTFYERNNAAITGTMPNNGALNYTPTTSQQTIPEGYTSGGTIGAISDDNLLASNIKDGVTILGVTGTYTGAISQADLDIAEEQISDLFGEEETE